MGTAVIVGPWWNPVRLAHETSMLDVLLKGRRLHLGIGRGIAPHEYASLNIPIEQSHDYFYDVVNAIRASDGAERFTFEGKLSATHERGRAKASSSTATSRTSSSSIVPTETITADLSWDLITTLVHTHPELHETVHIGSKDLTGRHIW